MNIILFSRNQVKHHPEQLRAIFNEIAELGLDYVINEDFARCVESLTELRIEPHRIFRDKAPITGNDVMVTCGGDGTLLEAVTMLPSDDIPVVGINSGRLGYLTVDDGNGIKELFERIDNNELEFERRLMLHAEGMIEGVEECIALNEISIHRYGATMISVETHVNGNYVATYYGDGLVISTPTGSTAYSLSAGGPIVDPLCRCFVLSPIAPHNLTMRPLVIPDSSIITLRIQSRSGKALISADNRTYALNDGAEIRVKLAHKKVILATPHNNTFYDTLREKMMWGIDKR